MFSFLAEEEFCTARAKMCLVLGETWADLTVWDGFHINLVVVAVFAYHSLFSGLSLLTTAGKWSRCSLVWWIV